MRVRAYEQMFCRLLMSTCSCCVHDWFDVSRIDRRFRIACLYANSGQLTASTILQDKTSVVPSVRPSEP
jgi:hypothetical protein